MASVSKVFTALAAASLVTQGRVSLDEDVREGRDWLQTVAPGAQPVTLRQLLTHTAGFDDRAIGMLSADAETLQPLANYLRRQMPRRTTEPGRWSRYSNHGAALAGLVIEETMGVPFAIGVQQLVLDPLQMYSSTFAEPTPDRLRRRLVRAFPCADATCQPLPSYYRHTSPAGALVTTANDMRRFLDALLHADSSPLGSDAVELLLSRAWSPRLELPGIALAVQEQSIAGHRALVHSGGSAGYKSLLALVPDAQSGLFVVTSGGSSRFGSGTLEIFSDLLASEGRGTTVHDNAQALTASDLDEYAGPYLLSRAAKGSYESFPGRFLFSQTVGTDTDGFLTRVESGTVRRYGRIDGDLFGAVDGPEVMAFERDSAGTIVGLHASDVFFGVRYPASYERLAVWASARFTNELLSWLLGLPVMAVLAWGVADAVRVWRRRRNSAESHVSPRRGALGWGGLGLVSLVTGLDLAFGFGFMARLNAMAIAAPEVLALGLPAELAQMLWLPWVIAASSLCLVTATLHAWWKTPSTPLTDRILMSVASVCSVGFAALLVYFRMLPPTA